MWGLAFKPRTDDMREAPAITIVEKLLALGASVRAYDPEAAETARRIFGDRITYCTHGYDALKGADALAVVTEWNEFREPDFAQMKQLLKSR
ncbi:MAG: UDP binding domain-containing protein [Vicinamibacterales bacterium]